MRILALLTALFFAQPAFSNGARCHAEVPCELPSGSYHVKEPDGWDGESPLPVMLHFHGWQRQGDLIVKHQRISGATRRRGVLLVAPNGPGRSWDWWNPDTANIDFAADVLADVAQRYPIDKNRIYVSGYSWGASMAWRYVCARGQDVAALLAVSGTLDQEETCDQAPFEVRHVHGLADTVMDFPHGPGGVDDTYPVFLWRRALGCGAARDAGTWQQRDFLTFQRTVWDDCTAGYISLDVHPGGHFIPHGWFARQLDELLGLPNSYP